MRIVFIAFALFLQACSSNSYEEVITDATDKDHPVCDLPYTPYQATVAGYCQEKKAVLPEELIVITKHIEVKPESEIPEFFWYTKDMRYTLAKQDSAAPLAFVIAGTGASHDSAKNISLIRTLHAQGYHVIALSSPTFPNYIINAATDADMIGDLRKDAKNLYGLMQKVYAQTQSEDGVEATSFSLTGYSLGGAHSAFVSKLDEEEKKFNFEKVVMVNPPVSLFNSVSILDGYIDVKNNRAAIRKMIDEIFNRFSQGYAKQSSSKFDSDTIYQLFAGANMTDEELKMLIGLSFRMSSSDMMYAIERVYNIGALNYKNHEVSKFESVTHSMYRADTIAFTDYFERAMVPWTQRIEPEVTRDIMIDRLSLISLEDYLSSSDKISVVHNADDIILKEGEIDYLKGVFGERAKIFERGGHCGNMDRESFVEHMNKEFVGAAL